MGRFGKDDPTAGKNHRSLGVFDKIHDFFKLFHIDGAYAYDNFVNENAFYAQLKIGW